MTTTSNERRPRVLFVGAFPPKGSKIVGGVIASCTALLDSELTDLVDFELLDSTQKSNPPPGLVVRGFGALGRLYRFGLLLVRARPDMVLIFLSAGASVVEKGLMGWLGRAAGVPVLLFPRAGSVLDAASRSRVIRALTRVFLGSGTVFLCQSEAWRDFAIRDLGYAPPNAIVVSNWTAGPEFLEVGRTRTAQRPPGAPLRVVFIGWVEKEKGIFDLLRACSILRGAHGFTLDVVGDGTARPEAEEFCSTEGLADVVRFRGWLSQEDVRGVLARSDAFVLPSWTEGLPNSMIEAMAARVPVVVTGVGGIPDAIVDGETGLLVAPRSPECLARALGRLMTCETLRAGLANAAFEVAKQRYSRAAAVTKFREAFSLALGRAV